MELFADEGIQVDDEQVVEGTRATIPAEDVESPAVQADGEDGARWQKIWITMHLVGIFQRFTFKESKDFFRVTFSFENENYSSWDVTIAVNIYHIGDTILD